MTSVTNRRAFAAGLPLGAIGMPVASRAQYAEGSFRIGFLPIALPSNTYDQSLVEAFRQGLREVGLIEKGRDD